VIASLLGLPAQDWSALATSSAVIVALVGGVIAFWQLRHTRSLRREQARPYVAVFLAPTRNESVIFDLVIKNFGATAATNIEVRITPQPERAIDKGDPNSPGLIVPDVIPTLVPGQEWRTIWDSAFARYDSDLPRRHDAIASYFDSYGKQHTYPYVIDWSTLFDTEFARSYGVDDVAKALEDISKTMAKWTESVHGKLSVVARDGDAGDRREGERRNQRLAERGAQRPSGEPPA
jgi:hypothetical protein